MSFLNLSCLITDIWAIVDEYISGINDTWPLDYKTRVVQFTKGGQLSYLSTNKSVIVIDALGSPTVIHSEDNEIILHTMSTRTGIHCLMVYDLMLIYIKFISSEGKVLGIFHDLFFTYAPIVVAETKDNKFVFYVPIHAEDDDDRKATSYEVDADGSNLQLSNLQLNIKRTGRDGIMLRGFETTTTTTKKIIVECLGINYDLDVDATQSIVDRFTNGCAPVIIPHEYSFTLYCAGKSGFAKLEYHAYLKKYYIKIDTERGAVDENFNIIKFDAHINKTVAYILDNGEVCIWNLTNRIIMIIPEKGIDVCFHGDNDLLIAVETPEGTVIKKIKYAI